MPDYSPFDEVISGSNVRILFQSYCGLFVSRGTVHFVGVLAEGLYGQFAVFRI